MKLLAAALAGALVAGSAVYVWRDAELDSRQTRLLLQAERATQAVLTADRLHQEVEQLQGQIETLKDRVGEATLDPGITREPDGRYFGYIESIALGDSPSTLTIDFALMLSGSDAQEAAEDAGYVAEGEPVPNDYYIVNENPKLRTLEISPDVRVTLETWDRHNIPDPKRVDIDLLARIFTRPKPWEGNVVANGYWLTIEDGAIAKLREQYVP